MVQIEKPLIEDRIKAIIADLGFGDAEQIQSTDQLIDDLGMDSLDVAELSMRIDKEYETSTDYEVFLKMGEGTVGGVVEYLDSVLNPVGI